MATTPGAHIDLLVDETLTIGPPARDVGAAFGGNGKSGFGREGGTYSFRHALTAAAQSKG